MKKEHLKWLQKNNACNPSLIWIKQNNIQSLEEAWYACERGDWLLLTAEHLGVDRHKLVLCGAICAHTVIQYMQDSRSRNAVRIAFLWGRGKATDEQLELAKAEALAAADTAVATCWSAAALSPDNAISWARTIAAACWSAAALSPADAAAWAITASADKKSNQLRTAEIARKVLTEDVMKKLKEIK